MLRVLSIMFTRPNADENGYEAQSVSEEATTKTKVELDNTFDHLSTLIGQTLHAYIDAPRLPAPDDSHTHK